MQEPEVVSWHTANGNGVDNGMVIEGHKIRDWVFSLPSFIEKASYNDSATASFWNETLLSTSQCGVYSPSDGNICCS